MNETNPKDPILIVDDEPSILRALAAILRANGFNNTVTCADSRDVMGILASRCIELVLLDLTLPFISGRDLLPLIREAYPEIPVIIVTGTSEIAVAVECMRLGVFDYLVKAVEERKLVNSVSRAIELRHLCEESAALQRHIVDGRIEAPEVFSAIVTCSERMRTVFLQVESIAPTAQVVLVTGETGVGKELVARAIHDLSGRNGEMVTVNIGGLDDTMLSDSLFGHLPGAFTDAQGARKGLVERAAGGSLFLDEIGEVRASAQVKLLRLLENGEYYPLGADAPRRSTARVIAATNRDLAREVKEGRFRKDLFYRLATHRVHIPSLRERPEDIPLLAGHYLEMAAGEMGRTVDLSPRSLSALRAHPLPGNARELKAIIYGAVGAARGPHIEPDALAAVMGAKMIDELDSFEAPPITFGPRLPTLKEADTALVEEALRRATGNQSSAARMLGITSQALNMRVRKKRTATDETAPDDPEEAV